jgi:thiol-disulfide isomerase/thioredoxin
MIMISCGPGRGERSATSGGNPAAKDVKVGIKIGERAPDLVFKSPEGKNISLSSLRGKMVLVDFWAAWCSPCRQENPHLVELYKKYRDKAFINGSGFTVYGVSLDRSKEDWVGAIEEDGLIWEAHVSDLKGAQSVPAAMYGVMAIPMNFLIDGDGIIVAKGLRGEYLENKLKELSL